MKTIMILAAVILLTSTVQASERYMHSCGKTTVKATVIRNSNPYPLNAVNEFKKFYPLTNPKIRRVTKGVESFYYVKATTNGKLVRCVFTGTNRVVRKLARV